MEAVDNTGTLKQGFIIYNKDHQIYCSGELLHDIQLAELFKDSKTFVDFRLKFKEDEIVQKYKKLKAEYNGTLTRKQLKTFVQDNFDKGQELESWLPEDWTKEPSILNKIYDGNFKKWAVYLNTMWRVLARKVKEEVKENPDLFSLIYVPNGFIIPGGRFTELYYWDTFWIVNGLLLCDMKDTARGVIDNLIHLVKLFGHVPNGSRIYYVTRSQPPVLIQMADSYARHTNDYDFIQENLKHLEAEFMYWWENHIVNIEKNGKYYKLARYFSYAMGPRPESYREDYLVAQDFPDPQDKDEFYIKIRSAAETGWDFSSRWFVWDATNKGNLSNIAAPQIIPVDLNSFLQSNAVILSNWFSRFGEADKSKEYKEKSETMLEGMSEILWHEDLGVWLDYDNVNKVRRDYFYASNLAPLFTYSYKKSWSRQELSDKIINYLRRQMIEEYAGGIPTSLDETGEQWDFPNAWAPLQAIMIQGLDRLGTEDSQEEAYRYAEKWIQSNYRGFREFKTMFEKYDVLRPGTTGEGGEYAPQTGFGWTNGVVLEFFDRWGDEFEAYSTAADNELIKEKSFRLSKYGFLDVQSRKSFSDLYRNITVDNILSDGAKPVYLGRTISKSQSQASVTSDTGSETDLIP